ncbi:MAG: redoxin domain-containing protein [Thermoplasmatota archaeon]
MNDTTRIVLLCCAILAIAAGIAWLGSLGTPSNVPDPPADLPAAEASYAGAADFAGATGWLNTPNGAAVDLVSLRGQVVLVDFWTYSCINCIHTLPHVTRLHDTYHGSGFTVIGVHTPEFAFEKRADNVQKAIAEYGIHYPVPQDNDDSIWNGYHNHYWPAHYVIDAYGKVRFTHFGEGGYAETEQQVRQLLAEAGHTDLPAPFEGGVETSTGGHTGELYAGYRGNLGNPEGYHEGQVVDYARPAAPIPDRIHVVGRWFDGTEELTAVANASILLRFSAAGGNVVLDGATGCLPMTLDGRAVPADLAGPDVDVTHSCLRVAGADSYDFYAGAYGTHTVELQAPPELQLYTFDFTGE